jgi:maleylpyruvate isomerase
VDLATGLSFGDLPGGFLAALCRDVIARRGTAPGPAMLLEAADTGGCWELSGDGAPIVLCGPLAEITAYLTGRPHKLTTAGGDPAPTLGPWL